MDKTHVGALDISPDEKPFVVVSPTMKTAMASKNKNGTTGRKRKVIVRLKGGLGNQLFCYAAARRLALANGAELIIDDVTGFVRDRQYRRRYLLDRFHISARKATPSERMEPFERYRRGLVKFVEKHRAFRDRKYLEQEGIEFDPRLLNYEVKETVYLDGLWQSERYFKDIEAIIREDLRIVLPADERNRKIAEKIVSCNSVAVHVRWFDEPGPENTGGSYTLKRSYYACAIGEISAKVSQPHFFLFSDNPVAARELIPLQGDAITLVDHNEGEEQAYADLWFMTQCKHFIIANSTFSWWGAWLANTKSKLVIAPNIKLTGLTSWGFEGQVPEQWVLV